MGIRTPPKTRVVNYQVTAHQDLPYKQLDRVRKLLEKSPMVLQFVAKSYANGCIIWWEGPPGKEMRKVRDGINDLLGEWKT